MKKNYQTPETKVIVIEAQPLLSGSENLGGSKGTFDAGNQTQLGRGGSDWDED